MRLKMRCSYVGQHKVLDELKNETVSLVYAGAPSEAGCSVSLSIVRPEDFGHFVVDREYDLTFTEPTPTASDSATDPSPVA